MSTSDEMNAGRRGETPGTARGTRDGERSGTAAPKGAPRPQGGDPAHAVGAGAPPPHAEPQADGNPDDAASTTDER